MTDASEWQEITDELLSQWGWDMPLCRLRDDEGNEGVGSYGFEDENCDGDYYFAWHREDGVSYLGFTPTHYIAPALAQILIEEGA